jgi:autotransporter-associated beta strand protein
MVFLMRALLFSVVIFALVGGTRAQTVRTWESDADQRWSRNANWSGNRPNNSNEIAEFGTGTQLNPELNANNYTIRGIQFSSGADSYQVGDDNGSRTLRIGSGAGGFIDSLSSNDQLISIATLQFQSDATISTAGTGALTLSSNLTGNNRDLTFSTTGNITVTGNITTGSGTLTKQGGADLNLAGTNTYTGLTAIEAGAIVLQASEVFADTSSVDISSGASLRLNSLSETIAQLSGTGTVDFGSGGTLALGAGTSTFAGDFAGSGTLIIRAGATFALGADFANTGLNLVLDGGSLLLAGHSLTLGTVTVTDNSLIDFGPGGLASVLDVASLDFAGGGLGLSVQSWADASDYFYSQTAYAQGSAPLNQITFQGWSSGDTRWQSYDSQITPVPEPEVYGSGLLGLLLVAGWWRRHQRRLRS